MPDLFNILIILTVVWSTGKAFRRIGLPEIFGELLAGIVVGPSMLNVVHMDSESIHVLSELGIFFLMLHAGLKEDYREFLLSGKKGLIIALGGSILPCIGGIVLGNIMGFSLVTTLFIATSVSTSAIAISARLANAAGLEGTKVSGTSLSAEIFTDILVLILFSFTLSIAENGSISFAELPWTLLKICLFFGGVITIGVQTSQYLPFILYRGNRAFTFTLIIALSLGIIAEAMGLHLIIGAFLAGLFIRQEVIDQEIFRKIEDRIYGISYGFLAPIFFASMAMHVDLEALQSAPVLLLVISAIAVFGKVLGASSMAYMQSHSRNESIMIGLLLNNRGTVEFIIASVALSEGIISTTIYSVLIAMAIGTTLLNVILVMQMARKITSEGELVQIYAHE